MKKIILLLLATLAPLYLADAKTYKLPVEDSIAQIEFPKNWDVSFEEDTLNAYSDDNEIYINIELHDGESVKDAVEACFTYLKENKVSIKEKSLKETNIKINGMDVADLSWDGKSKDGPCKISLSFVGIAKDQALVMLYWASPEAEKKYEEELSGILQSIRPIKKK